MNRQTESPTLQVSTNGGAQGRKEQQQRQSGLLFKSLTETFHKS